MITIIVSVFMVICIVIDVYVTDLYQKRYYNICTEKISGSLVERGSVMYDVEPGYIECCEEVYVNHKTEIKCEIYEE